MIVLLVGWQIPMRGKKGLAQSWLKALGRRKEYLYEDEANKKTLGDLINGEIIVLVFILNEAAVLGERINFR